MLTKNSVDEAGTCWAEAVSGSFFENSRTGGDELWGTALVDGDGSTNTQAKLLVALVDSRTLEHMTMSCWGQL